MASMTIVVAIWTQEAGASSRSPTGEGPKALSYPMLLSQAISRLKCSSHMGGWCCRQRFNVLCHDANPYSSLKKTGSKRERQRMRKRERNDERFSFAGSLPKWQQKPSWSQEPKNSSRFSMWMKEGKHLDHFLLPSQICEHRAGWEAEEMGL